LTIFFQVHTVSSAISGILYCLAKNSEKQELLREEIMNALPDKKSKLTIDNMRELPYLRAVIKESLRMFPPTSNFFGWFLNI
jgi:cytochrome P450 family 12